MSQVTVTQPTDLNLSHERSGEWLDHSTRKGQRYADGARTIPGAVEKLLLPT